MLGLELIPEHSVDDLAELGAQAEREDYDSCFVLCHYNNRDFFAVLVRLAAETDDIHLGPGVANPYELHPVTLAGGVTTAIKTSGGRGLLGIGPDNPSTLRDLDPEDECGPRSVLKAFKVAQKPWDDERVSYDGTFEATDAGLNFDVPDEVPVYISGKGPHTCRMAGRHAGGLLFSNSRPNDLAWAREQVDIGVEDRLDSRGEFTLATYASVSVSEDADAAREAARPPVVFIATGAAPSVLDRHGIDTDCASGIGEKIPVGNFSEALGLVTPAMIDASSVADMSNDAADRMDVVLEYTNSVMVGSPVGSDLEEAITLAAVVYRSMNRHR